jgi:2-polyprenyl-3-methyl-5-hydroxy-6-metoxy-1,4-benzoquinol methylase
MSNNGQSYVDSCPIGCESGFHNSDIVLPEGPLRRCKNCGQLVSQCSEELYWNSMKEFDDPIGTLPTGKAAYRLSRHTKRILDEIEHLSGKKKSGLHLLDVGCSSGPFILAARDFGVEAEGVEPSPGPARSAKQSGLKVYQGYLNDIKLPEESFDVITLFEVLEHLREPLSLFKECHRILRSGGLLVIRTGNTDSWTVQCMKGRWKYFSIREHGGHISFFNPLSMRKLAERSGFMVADIKTHRVCFYEKGDVPFIYYRLIKIVSELLNTPASLCGKGHEMRVYLRKQKAL